MKGIYFWHISVVFFAAVLSSLLVLEEPVLRVSDSPLILTDPSYRYDNIDAPIATGWKLQLLSYILTRTRFVGPLILRRLCYNNGVTKIRQLASQIPKDLGVMPLHFPLQRLNKSQRKQHDDRAGVFDRAFLKRMILTGESLLNETFPINSRVLHYHKQYLKNDELTSPTRTIEKTLRAVDEYLQQEYKFFTLWPPSEENRLAILNAATKSTERFLQGNPLSIWDGVPVGFKDCFDIKGYVNTDGSNYFATTGKPAASNDELIEVFKKLGAVVLPPLNMVEGGVSPLGYNSWNGGPFNPHSPEIKRYSGGSSSGSAVAVSLGVTPVSLGMDGGGSIRTPASFSGLMGFAFGIGRAAALSERVGTNTKIGPLATESIDVALVYATITTRSWLFVERNSDDWPDHGYYEVMYDGGMNGLPQPHLGEFFRHMKDRDLTGIRLGVFADWINDSQPVISKAINDAIEEMVKHGAKVIPIFVPHLGTLRLSHAMKIASEFARRFDVPYHSSIENMLEHNTRITVGLGAAVSALDVLCAETLRDWAFKLINDEVFGKLGVTAIVTPTTSMIAPVINVEALVLGESNTPLQVELLKYVFLANFLGLPSIAVPLGLDPSHRMPMSIAFTGPQWSEDVLLRISNFFDVPKYSIPKPKDYLDAFRL